MVFMNPTGAECEEDPILALCGVGKDLWQELGGGENFIRELRASWDEWTSRGDGGE